MLSQSAAAQSPLWATVGLTTAWMQEVEQRMEQLPEADLPDWLMFVGNQEGLFLRLLGYPNWA